MNMSYSIGFQIQKPLQLDTIPAENGRDTKPNPAENTYKKYSECADWCNKNNAYIEDKGDYFVLMVIGVDADHNVYVLDYVKERLTFNTQLNTIIDYGRNKFPMVERIGVETVAYQKSLAQELRRLSLLPIININTSKDKVTRAMRRSANFENHKVYFREGMDDLEECLLLFPEVDHDDLFDALDFAMTMADGGNEIRVLKREDFRI